MSSVETALSTTSPTRSDDEDAFTYPSRWTTLLQSDTLRLFAGLLALCALFSLLRPQAFPTASNILSIMADSSVLLVLAVGATYVIITAGIDLSVGGVLVFSGVVAAKFMVAQGGDGIVTLLGGLIVALVAGAAWGLLNGYLVGRASIPPLITTLATLGAAIGASLLITNGVDVTGIPFTLVESVGSGRVLGIPVLVIIAAVVALLFGVLLSQTQFGRYTYATGSNAEALRRTGVNTTAHLIKVYGLAGMLAGLGGYLSLARFATTTLGGHSTDNLQAITAVVIGGASLFGGRGVIAGTVIGVFIPTVLRNGFVVMGVSAYWQQIAIGAVLLAAVYVDQARRKARDR